MQGHHSLPRHYVKVSGQLYVPTALPRGERALGNQCKVGRHQSQSGRFMEDENPLPLSGIDPRSSGPYPSSVSLY
jgi:hypothetical protein